MPHPKELLEKITAELSKSYPPDQYRYAYETWLRHKDRSVQPDIQVFAKLDDVLACVVEIGYTRPEKIKLYHAQGIRDVRWYSKQGELVNLDVETRKEIIEREFKFVMHPNDVWICVSAAGGDFHCPSLVEGAYQIRNQLLEHLPKIHSTKRLLREACRLIRKSLVAELHDICMSEVLDGLQDYNPPNRLTEEFVLNVFREALFSLSSQTRTVIYSNGMRLFSVICCDECCKTEILYSLDETTFMSGDSGLIVNRGHVSEYDALESYDNFLKYHARLQREGWFEAAFERIPCLDLPAHVQQRHGVLLDLEPLAERAW